MGTGERKEREREQRRRAIMEAAREVFFANGLMNSTMDEIAEKAELSKGTLYLYFDSKEELYLSLLDEGLEILLEMFEQAASQDLPADAVLLIIGEAYYQFYLNHKNYFKILFFYEHSELHGSVCQEAPEKGLKCLSLVARVIQEGIDGGAFRQDLNAVEVASILWANSNGIIHLIDNEGEHLLQEMGIDPESLLHKSWELLLSAIGVK